MFFSYLGNGGESCAPVIVIDIEYIANDTANFPLSSLTTINHIVNLRVIRSD